MLVTLQGMLTRLDALCCSEQRTALLRHLENVFGCFYDWEALTSKLLPISDGYVEGEWNAFRSDILSSVRDKTSVHCICSVMHIKASYSEPSSYVIENIGVRPCAFPHGFLSSLLSDIAKACPPDTSLEIRVPALCGPLVTNTLNGVSPRSGTRSVLTISGTVSINESVFVLGRPELNQLARSPPWTAPAALDLNTANDFIETIADQMLSLASVDYKSLLSKPSNDILFVPPFLELDQNGLMVYKQGQIIPYYQEEETSLLAMRNKIMDNMGKPAEFYIEVLRNCFLFEGDCPQRKYENEDLKRVFGYSVPSPETAAALDKYLTPESIVLEVGSGNGLYARVFADKVHTWIASDLPGEADRWKDPSGKGEFVAITSTTTPVELLKSYGTEPKILISVWPSPNSTWLQAYVDQFDSGTIIIIGAPGLTGADAMWDEFDRRFGVRESTAVSCFDAFDGEKEYEYVAAWRKT